MEKDLKIILDEEEAERRDGLKPKVCGKTYIISESGSREGYRHEADTFGKSDAYCTL